MKIQIKIVTFVLLATVLSGCNLKKAVRFSGNTMGTTYHIKIVTGFFDRTEELEKKVAQRLDAINMSMSTFIKDSEISRFNAYQKTETPFPVSDDFHRVMRKAEEIYRLTEGAWDGTIDPLVNRWGFGRAAKQDRPSKEEVETLLQSVGFDQIVISDNNTLIKKWADLKVDLASIAKGYAVDQITQLINQHGFKNCLVEIGGEVFASGIRKDGKKWRVGINMPRKDASLSQVYKVVTLVDKALATSGDYRNFFESGGVRYSHVIDPRTGFPVKNGVVSVSILADSCTLADGLATAIMVMGHTKGLELVNRLANVECLIIVIQDDGTLMDYPSDHFKTVP